MFSSFELKRANTKRRNIMRNAFSAAACPTIYTASNPYGKYQQVSLFLFPFFFVSVPTFCRNRRRRRRRRCRCRACVLQLKSTLMPSLISFLKESIMKWRCSCAAYEFVSACVALTVAAKSYNHIIKALKSNFLIRSVYVFSFFLFIHFDSVR